MLPSTEHVFELLAAFRRTRPHLRLIVVGLEEDHAYIQRVIGAGAKGYLSHAAREDEIRMALHIVHGWIGVGAAKGAGAVAGDVCDTCG